jgi:hypothetical protein
VKSDPGDETNGSRLRNEMCYPPLPNSENIGASSKNATIEAGRRGIYAAPQLRITGDVSSASNAVADKSPVSNRRHTSP